MAVNDAGDDPVWVNAEQLRAIDAETRNGIRGGIAMLCQYVGAIETRERTLGDCSGGFVAANVLLATGWLAVRLAAMGLKVFIGDGSWFAAPIGQAIVDALVVLHSYPWPQVLLVSCATMNLADRMTTLHKLREVTPYFSPEARVYTDGKLTEELGRAHFLQIVALFIWSIGGTAHTAAQWCIYAAISLAILVASDHKVAQTQAELTRETTAASEASAEQRKSAELQCWLIQHRKPDAMGSRVDIVNRVFFSRLVNGA